MGQLLVIGLVREHTVYPRHRIDYPGARRYVNLPG